MLFKLLSFKRLFCKTWFLFSVVIPLFVPFQNEQLVIDL